MKALPLLFPLAVLALKRHAAAMLLDALGHPPRYLVVALGTWSLMTVAALCGLLCAAVLVWNYVRYERPLNRRRP